MRIPARAKAFDWASRGWVGRLRRVRRKRARWGGTRSSNLLRVQAGGSERIANALLCVAYETLARRSELVALELRDIEFWPNGIGQALVRRRPPKATARVASCRSGCLVQEVPDVVRRNSKRYLSISYFEPIIATIYITDWRVAQDCRTPASRARHRSNGCADEAPATSASARPATHAQRRCGRESRACRAANVQMTL